MLAAVCFAPLLKCMCFLELQIIRAVHLAKPFGHHTSLGSRTVQQGTHCDFKGIPLAVASGSTFPGITLAFWSPCVQKPTRLQNPALVLPALVRCHRWPWDAVLSSTVNPTFRKVGFAEADLLLTSWKARINI